jgi:hypothetical protein
LAPELHNFCVAYGGRETVDSLINEFLQECTDNLNRLDHDFVALQLAQMSTKLQELVLRLKVTKNRHSHQVSV